MKRWNVRRPWRELLSLVLSLGLGAWLASGCAARRPGEQAFVRVETPWFEIASAFGPEETRRLARDLELFHAGCLSLFGLDETPAGHVRSRVLAFDDRALGRPFGRGAEASYLVPDVDRATIVFRVPGDWNERASRSLRVDYARRLLRSVSPQRLPLWLEAGLAEAASAIELRGNEVRLGAVVEEHARTVESWRQSSFASMLHRSHIVGASASERAIFEAQAWATVHALVFPATGGGSAERAGQAAPLAEILSAWRAGAVAPWDSGLGAGVSSGESLSTRVYAYLAQGRHPMRVLRPFGWTLDSLALQRLEQADVEAMLGELALSLGRFEQARLSFERALRERPEQPLALAGLARAQGVVAFAEAEPLVARALAVGAEDAEVRRRIGTYYGQGVEAAAEDGERSRRAQAAQTHLAASVALDPSSATSRVALARVMIELGRWDEATQWLEEAARLRPASLEVDAVFARLRFRQGQATAARLRARDVYSRTRWAPLREAVAPYLEDPPS